MGLPHPILDNIFLIVAPESEADRGHSHTHRLFMSNQQGEFSTRASFHSEIVFHNFQLVFLVSMEGKTSQ